MSSLYRRLRLRVRKLWRILLRAHDTPHSIAGGVAIGVVLGFTPFFGLKTVLAVGVAWLLGYSRVGAVVAVTLHDITLPLTPLLLKWEYEIGRWIVGLVGVHAPAPSYVKVLHWKELLQWQTLRSGAMETLWPLFLGSLVISLPVGFLCYLLTLRAVAAHRTRLAARKGESRSLYK